MPLPPALANAEVAGMTTDLNLTGLRYNTAVAVFFVRIHKLFAFFEVYAEQFA